MATRENASAISNKGLQRLRDAYNALLDLDDERGYQHFAGIHGLPLPIQCKHSTGALDILFLPWHRAYLHFLELSMQDAVADAAIPWWNWTSERSHQQGLPTAFSEAEEPDGTANVLRSVRLGLAPEWITRLRNHPVLRGTITSGNPARTRRDPDPPDELPRLQTLRSIFQAPSYQDFSRRLENVHGGVHGWVGGTMSQVPTAAFDPIFWSHHSFIDFLWHLWQQSPMGQDPPPNLLDVVLDPFPMTVRQTLRIENLGYDYAFTVAE